MKLFNKILISWHNPFMWKDNYFFARHHASGQRTRFSLNMSYIYHIAVPSKY